jgi:hypothetical protein
MKVVLSMEMMNQTIFELVEGGGGVKMNQNIMKISMPQIHKIFLRISHQIGNSK